MSNGNVGPDLPEFYTEFGFLSENLKGTNHESNRILREIENCFLKSFFESI